MVSISSNWICSNKSRLTDISMQVSRQSSCIELRRRVFIIFSFLKALSHDTCVHDSVSKYSYAADKVE